MLTSTITCPYCNSEFSAPVWIDGSCEKCGGNYYWSMEFNEELTDGWHVIEWDQSKSVYVATTLSNWRRARAILDFCRSLKIDISFDWTIWGEEIEKGPRDLDSKSLREKALQEYVGVASASYILIISPTGRGTNFEYGVAYQRIMKDSNKPEIAILEETQSTEPVSFHYLPVKRFSCMRSAIADMLNHFGINIKDIDVDLAAFGLQDYR
jgi:hypothetical protein